jgi:hypothetical protein
VRCSTLIHAEKVVGQAGIRKQQRSPTQSRVECLDFGHFLGHSSGLFFDHLCGALPAHSRPVGGGRANLYAPVD